MSGKREKYDIICKEKQVQVPFGITGVVRGRSWNAVRYEYERCKWIWQIFGNIWSKNLPIDVQYDGDEEQLEGRGSILSMSVGHKNDGQYLTRFNRPS